MVDDVDRHNYMKKIRNYFPDIYSQIRARPGLYVANVAHDAWCNLLTGNGEYCNCDPEIDMTGSD